MIAPPPPDAPPVYIIRADATALLANKARAMTPQALADAVLAPGHAPVVRATLHPFGMEAPSAMLLGVDLGTAARPALEAGFCVSDVVRVAFATLPGAPDVSFEPAPAGAVRYSVVHDDALAAYGRADSCAEAKAFFRIDPVRSDDQLELVRLLAAARREAATNRGLAFDLTYDNLNPTVFPTFATPRAALASLPLDAIVSSEPAHDVRESTLGSTRLEITRQWRASSSAVSGRSC